MIHKDEAYRQMGQSHLADEEAELAELPLDNIWGSARKWNLNGLCGKHPNWLVSTATLGGVWAMGSVPDLIGSLIFKGNDV